MNRILRRNILAGLTALLLLVPAGSLGASETPADLSLEEALSLGLETNLEVARAKEELDKAEGLLTQARSALLPALSAVGSATGRNEDSSKPEREGTGSLALSQTLYAGGVIRAGEQQALLNRQKAQESLEETRETVALKVYEAFCGVLLRGENLKTAEDALGYYDKATKDLRKRLELGLSTRLDLSRMEQQRENARVDAITAANNLSAARIVLFTLLRLPPEAPTVVSGDLTVTAVSVDAPSLAAQALNRRPDLLALRTAAAIQKQAVDIAKAGMRPTVTLTGSYQFVYDSNPSSNTKDDDWTATLNVSVPLFDGGKTRGKVAQERAALRQAEQGVSQKEDAVRAEVVDAGLTLNSAAEAVTSARKNLDLARESLRLAEVGYREGVDTQLDVLAARTSVTEARQKLSGAQRDHRVALARLWRSQGILVDQALKAR